MTGQIAGLILAGGLSRRMGGTDKALLPLHGQPLIGRVLDRLRPQATPIAINTNGDPAPFQPFGVDIIADTLAGYQGPLAGILAGFEWATVKPKITHLLSVAGDTPFFPPDLAARLATAGDPARIRVAASAGRLHPTFALWPVQLRDKLAAFLESGDIRRVITFLEQTGMDAVDFPNEQLGRATVDPFFNINTPEDLAQAERLLSGA
ncbi:molybdenum cofactor guanylyltransferase MobA [Mesorhizobium sp. ANAO-SY3R2]|uniref:molybdenum cofactor guanylyltransferase MobA n=1 Tax=Mesorhizobium sp. ANAO-SY3R2 TaxID=3166644 RepID=UPI00366E24B2